MPSKKLPVLVVDDSAYMQRLLQRILEMEGFKVTVAANGQAALDVFAAGGTPELVLLDVVMPVMDGYTVCERIREFSQVPIIMVTAKGNTEEIAGGLERGADDYVVKPFSSQELMARVKAVLRRATLWEDQPEPEFRSGELSVDFAHHMVSLLGEEVTLTATEYRLLCYLARNEGRVVTPDQILGKVWGEEYAGESHLLQVTMARLREKLKDDAKNPKYISTRPGIGYMMVKRD